jgi:hypothetical protein
MQLSDRRVCFLFDRKLLENCSELVRVGHLGHLAHVHADGLSQSAEGGETLVLRGRKGRKEGAKMRQAKR